MDEAAPEPEVWVAEGSVRSAPAEQVSFEDRQPVLDTNLTEPRPRPSLADVEAQRA